MKLKLSLFISISLFLGCLPGPHQITTPLNENELAPYSKKGSAIIIGQAFLKTRGGDVRYGAACPIYLLPATRYTDDLMRGIVQERKIGTIDQRLNNYVRKTIGDGEGRFEFDNLPTGRYYLLTEIKWEVPTGYKYSLESTGGVAFAEVSIREGQKVKVILTR